MHPLAAVVLISWLAGLASWLGGVLGHHEGSEETELKREIIHGVMAFGGGILLAAISFALVPHAIEDLSAAAMTLTFCAGGGVFCWLDAWLAKRGGTVAQFMAMVMDFIPEAASLGAVFSQNYRGGLLLAGFIALQNLPEGFNAFRELRSAGARPRSALRALFAISFAGPVAACLGYFFLQDRPELTAGIMSFASGGILYLVFQDIAPQARLNRHWAPPLGAVLGFVLGMMGEKLLG